MKSLADKRATVQRLAAARAARSDSEQLRKLERRGFGQCREAIRLRARISSGGQKVA